jgi:hypothetical protein
MSKSFKDKPLLHQFAAKTRPALRLLTLPGIAQLLIQTESTLRQSSVLRRNLSVGTRLSLTCPPWVMLPV